MQMVTFRRSVLVRRKCRVSAAALAAAAFLSYSGLPALGELGARNAIVIESPLQPLSARPDETVIPLSLDLNAYRAIKSAENIRLTDFALGSDLRADLVLRRIEVFAENARIVQGTPRGDIPLPRPDMVLLSGRIADRPGSKVFLSLSPHGNNGLIWMAGKTFIVSSGRNANAAPSVVYELGALPPGTMKWRDFKCETDKVAARMPGLAVRNALIRQSSPATTTAASEWRRVQLAIETDREFTSYLFGGDMDAAGVYAGTLIAAVSEIYANNVDTSLDITYLRLWPGSTDPWDESDTEDQLYQFQDYWNLNMGYVERHAAHFLSGRSLGGGIAYVSALCFTGWDYGLSSGIDGYFPYPLQDNHGSNWDVFVVAHELGHNFGAPHTHDMRPPIDNCASGNCSVTPNGTIMSYCGSCPGGMTNILLSFHQRMIDERILPFLNSWLPCDLSGTPPVCEATQAPTAATLTATNRYLSFVGSNPGLRTAIRVTVDGLAPPYDELNGSSMWAGPQTIYCENSGQDLPPAEGCGSAPGLDNTFRAANLQCAPYYRDWTTAGPIKLFGDRVIPNGTYQIQEIHSACARTAEADYSATLAAITSAWGDIVKDCETTPCGPPDGTVDVTTDVTAILDKFKNANGALLKTRCDIEPAVPDRRINITDVTYGLDAFRGRTYSFPPPDPCP